MRNFFRAGAGPAALAHLPCREITALIGNMNFFIQRSELRDLYDKVVAGERISEADALRLLESKDLNAVGAIADFARQKKTGGNRASYIVNRYINYSNYCILSCQFCSFAKQETRRRRLPAFRRGNRREGARGAQARHHGAAHRRRTASVAAVQLLHGHAEGLEKSGCAAPAKMFHRD